MILFIIFPQNFTDFQAISDGDGVYQTLGANTMTFLKHTVASRAYSTEFDSFVSK